MIRYYHYLIIALLLSFLIIIAFSSHFLPYAAAFFADAMRARLPMIRLHAADYVIAPGFRRYAANIIYFAFLYADYASDI